MHVLFYCGTCTLVMARGKPCILTAAHVWERLGDGGFALSLDEHLLLHSFHKRVVTASVLRSPKFDGSGPDLALVQIPELDAAKIRVRKAFFDLDKRIPLKSRGAADQNFGIWAVLGAVGEQSTFTPTEAILGLRVYAGSISQPEIRDGFDYVEMNYDRSYRPRLPKFFGGISGSGLWQVSVVKSQRTGVISIRGAELEGVAFFQDAQSPTSGAIRCHGRNSIYKNLLPTRSD
jgi:hypothetical protein